MRTISITSTTLVLLLTFSITLPCSSLLMSDNKPPLPPRVKHNVNRKVDTVVNKLSNLFRPPPINFSTKPRPACDTSSSHYPGNIMIGNNPVQVPLQLQPRPHSLNPISMPPKPPQLSNVFSKPKGGSSSSPPKFRSVPAMYIEPANFHRIKELLISSKAGGPPIPKDIQVGLDALRKETDQAIKEKKTYSVTYSQSFCSAGRNHFYSEAPYFWPDEKQLAEAQEKYGDNVDMDTIQFYRIDGKRNPAVANATQCRELSELAYKVQYLTLGAAMWEDIDPAFATMAYHRIAQLLKVFFLDEDTKMLPSVEYGGVVRGLVPPALPGHKGRPEGILNTLPLAKLAITLPWILETNNPARETAQQVKQTFFVPLMQWHETDEMIAKKEREKPNNHGSYYLVQYVTFLSLLDRTDDAIRTLDTFFRIQFPNRIDQRGVLIREVTRATPFHYTAYELDALVFLADYAWRKYRMFIGYESANHGIKRAIDFALQWWWTDSKDPKKIEGNAQFIALYYSLTTMLKFYNFSPDSADAQWYQRALDEFKLPENWSSVNTARHRASRLFV